MAHFPTRDGRAPWRASVLTLFPEMFPGPLGLSLAGQALTAGLWTIQTHQIRDFGLGRHAQVDDTPAGGGVGMVLRADVLGPAIDHARAANPGAPAIYLSPELISPKVQQWLWLNPMHTLVSSFRAALLGMTIPWTELLIAMVLCVTIFSLSIIYFRKVEGTFADNI